MKYHRLLLILAAALWVTAASAQNYDFQNTKLKDDKRVELFLKHLTLDEKMAWMSTMTATERLGMPKLSCYEGLHGLALGGPAHNNGKKTVDGQEVPNDLPTTIFPQAYGMGCTWDRSLVRRIGAVEAEEARWYAQGSQARRKGLVVYAPNADLARDPRWGRTEESFGEDPYLTAQLSVAMVRGLQGDHPRYWKTAALMKHFLANSNEDGRDSTSSNYDERLFREYYSYPFYKGITEGGCRAFMASYNAWNGTPMCVHPCLSEIARREWGNNGIICTDGGAFSMLVSAHHYYPDLTAAAAAVVKAGTSQYLDRYQPYLKEAVERAEILREKGTNRSQFFRGQVAKYNWVDFGDSYLQSDLNAARQPRDHAESIRRHRQGHHGTAALRTRGGEAAGARGDGQEHRAAEERRNGSRPAGPAHRRKQGTQDSRRGTIRRPDYLRLVQRHPALRSDHPEGHARGGCRAWHRDKLRPRQPDGAG